MKKKMRRCQHCGCLFEVCNKVKKHEFCNKKECQKARKRKWQRDKMNNDANYRKDQKIAQEDWRNNNPDYWKNYRRDNQEYTDRNREQQQIRDRVKKAKSAPAEKSGPIAKMDALMPERAILSGKYQLVPIMPDMIAKMDALIVEINMISNNYTYPGL
jgi:hypothetical protein